MRHLCDTVGKGDTTSKGRNHQTDVSARQIRRARAGTSVHEKKYLWRDNGVKKVYTYYIESM
jgi:hypothetical protein